MVIFSIIFLLTSCAGLGSLAHWFFGSKVISNSQEVVIGFASLLVLVSFCLPVGYLPVENLILSCLGMGFLRFLYRIFQGIKSRSLRDNINAQIELLRSYFPVLLFSFIAYLRSAFVELNVDDDFTAYFPMATKLLAEGNLHEPFSLRRLSTWGGSSIAQAIFLSVTSLADLTKLETVLFPVICMWFLFEYLQYSRIILLTFFSLIFLADPYRVNFALSNGVIVFLLCGLVLAYNFYNTKDSGVGLMSSICLSAFALIRAHHVVFLAVFFLIFFLNRFLDRKATNSELYNLTIIPIALIGFSIPAALALFHDSGTPFYPLFKGNEVGSFATFMPVNNYFVRLLTVNEVTCLFCLPALIYLLHLHFKREIVYSYFLSYFFLAILFGFYTEAAPPKELARYLWPLLVVGLLLLLCDSKVKDILKLENPFRKLRTLRPARLRYKFIAVWFVHFLGLTWIAYMSIAVSITTASYLENLVHLMRNGIDPNKSTAQLTIRIDEYTSILETIPTNSKILASTETTFNLIGRSFETSTLDVPGNVWPGGVAPVFTKPEFFLDAIEHLGFDYFLYVEPLKANPWSFYSKRYWNGSARYFETILPFLKNWRPHFDSYFSMLNSLTALKATTCMSTLCISNVGEAKKQLK
jgi:hypothetical protein